MPKRRPRSTWSKADLIRDFGYDQESACDVLNYVASIFARGDVKQISKLIMST